MASQVYFGNAQHQTWIKSPTSGMGASSTGFVNTQQALNGRAFVKRSRASHREFSPSWVGSLSSTELSLQTIKDFADGVYGDGPFYWLDPFATNQNLLAPHWAAPGLAEKDWPTLDTEIIPTFDTTSIVNGYPATYAIYETAGAHTSTRVFRIIIPTGYVLKFGWHGPTAATAANEKGIKLIPYTRAGVAGTALTPDGIATSSTVRVNTTVNGTTYGYVDIMLSTSEPATVQISGMIAQVIPSTDSVETGGFISGKGTTGLEFGSFPQIEYYSSAINDGQIGMSASFIEVN